MQWEQGNLMHVILVEVWEKDCVSKATLQERGLLKRRAAVRWGHVKCLCHEKTSHQLLLWISSLSKVQLLVGIQLNWIWIRLAWGFNRGIRLTMHLFGSTVSKDLRYMYTSKKRKREKIDSISSPFIKCAYTRFKIDT